MYRLRTFLLANAMLAAAPAFAPDDGGGSGGGGDPWTDETPITEVAEEHRERVKADRLERGVATYDDAGVETFAPAPNGDEDDEDKEKEGKAPPPPPPPPPEPQATKKPQRDRRGPPADGKPEKTVSMILTTSKLSDRTGKRLRRGTPAAVPQRRVEALEKQGRARKCSAEELEIAKRRYGGLADLG